jgi:hypothetical protein
LVTIPKKTLYDVHDLMNIPETTDQKIKWICDQIRNAYGDRCTEDALHLGCSLEASVEEYFLNCEDDLSLGDIVQSYLDDNPEKDL